MEALNLRILKELKNNSVVALGGSEVVGVAYAVSLAKEKVEGKLKSIQITVDSSVFKNGLNVIIPGTSEKGLDMAAALGYVCGDASLQFQSITNCTDADIELAAEILNQGKIAIRVKDSCDSMFIEVLLETEIEIIRITVYDFKFKSVLVEKAKVKDEFNEFIIQPAECFIDRKYLSIQDLLRFVETIDEEELAFLDEGLTMNLALAQAYENRPSIAKSLHLSMEMYTLKDDMISKAQNLCMKACEAKMEGIKLPIMTSVGSANFGIVCYLANTSVATSLNVSKSKLRRSVALANLISLYVKNTVGSLSSICGCGIFTGVGVSASTAYLLGGDLEQILLAMKNMIGSITGIICEGNKKNCIWKLGLSVDWAIQSALLAMDEEFLDDQNVSEEEILAIIENISAIYSSFDKKSNQSIVDLLLKNSL